ncbi:hypothetical protein NDU88_003873 [Pleurodeles waltl]|uniref:Uncharacterized protein n=1 Tax=Pleurodeles waltl TaxID=8319 RepID=A0AAV7UFA2_PLEWA|nr:hypothetical protein NDU88_003873 [Pleurodeles waltl]
MAMAMTKMGAAQHSSSWQRHGLPMVRGEGDTHLPARERMQTELPWAGGRVASTACPAPQRAALWRVAEQQQIHRLRSRRPPCCSARRRCGENATQRLSARDATARGQCATCISVAVQRGHQRTAGGSLKRASKYTRSCAPGETFLRHRLPQKHFEHPAYACQWKVMGGPSSQVQSRVPVLFRDEINLLGRGHYLLSENKYI